MFSLLQLCSSLLVLFHFIKIHECVFDSDSSAAVFNLDVFVKCYVNNNVYLMKGGYFKNTIKYNTISINGGTIRQHTGGDAYAPITNNAFGQLYPGIQVTKPLKGCDLDTKTSPGNFVDPANSPNKYLAYYFDSDEVQRGEVKASDSRFRSPLLAVNILENTDNTYLHIWKSGAKEIKCEIFLMDKAVDIKIQQIFSLDIFLVLPYDGKTIVISDAASTQEILIIKSSTEDYTKLGEIIGSQLKTSVLYINTNETVKGWENRSCRQITKAEMMYADETVTVLKIWIKVVVSQTTQTTSPNSNCFIFQTLRSLTGTH